MIQVTPVSGGPGGECFLLDAGTATFLVDAGYAYCANRTLKQIRKVLGPRSLDYILLTHSHYDHASGAATIQAGYPQAKVVAAGYAKNILEKERARSLMRELNHKAAENAGLPVEDDQIDRLAVDLTVAEGDLIRVEGVTVRVLETPGHTRCCISYHFLEADLLAASESIGISPKFPQVIPVFIVSCAMALNSIVKCAALHPRQLLIPHMGVVSGKDAELFLSNARAAALEAADFILDRHAQGMSLGEIAEAFRTVAYTPAIQKMQPELAFRLNTEAMISLLLKEGKPVPTKTTRLGA